MSIFTHILISLEFGRGYLNNVSAKDPLELTGKKSGHPDKIRNENVLGFVNPIKNKTRMNV